MSKRKERRKLYTIEGLNDETRQMLFRVENERRKKLKEMYKEDPKSIGRMRRKMDVEKAMHHYELAYTNIIKEIYFNYYLMLYQWRVL
jgi:hypothetical protein